jgi:hypothetical protein
MLLHCFQSLNQQMKQKSNLADSSKTIFNANMFTSNNYNNTQHNKLFNKHLLSFQKLNQDWKKTTLVYVNRSETLLKLHLPVSPLRWSEVLLLLTPPLKLTFPLLLLNQIQKNTIFQFIKINSNKIFIT